ncbi:hypothetical protein [Aneurinibacillus migulanus]|nr:hypothetical protein [Aneurinibacillus migulanus]
MDSNGDDNEKKEKGNKPSFIFGFRNALLISIPLWILIIYGLIKFFYI